MPRRVLHVLGDSGFAGTGIARIVASLHRHAPNSDFELSACFMGGEGPLLQEFSRLQIPTRLIPWKHPSRDAAGALRFATFLATSRFDLVHFHWGGPTLRGLSSTLGRSKTVLHLHSSIEENLPGRPTHIDTRNSHAVIAVSRAVAASSLHRNTRVIYPGVDLPPQAPRAEDPALCGCSARLTPVKGVTYLLQALSRLIKDFPNVRVEIAGDGPERATLEAESTSLGLSQNVNFLGWCEALRERRASWAFMVQPSLEDGFPLAAVEAMSEGLPVIATQAGGLPEIIVDGQTGLLVPSADPSALADAMSKLSLDSSLRKRFGQASRARVQECFSAQRMAEETISLYRELLNE